jgi:Ser/Thr protein kinase RdoA (MazF antagonist)
MEPLLAELAALGEKAPAGPLVPTHRSFRPAQLLMAGDDMAFIDFDGFCQAEAGLDLALFRATLVDLSLRAMEKGDELLSPDEQQAAQIRLDDLCGTFLAGYEEVTQYSAERLALWDLLTSVKDILDCWRKIKFEHLERRMRFLHHKLGTLPVR